MRKCPKCGRVTCLYGNGVWYCLSCGYVAVENGPIIAGPSDSIYVKPVRKCPTCNGTGQVEAIRVQHQKSDE